MNGIYRNKKLVILLWMMFIIFFSIFAFKLPDVLSGNGFNFDGEFNETQQILENEFGQSKSSIIVLFEKNNNIANEVWKDFITATLQKAKQIPTVVEVISPFDGENMIKSNLAYSILLIEKESDRIDAVINELRTTLDDGNGIRVSLTGEPIIGKDLNEASQQDLIKAEMIGLPIALIVLILAFGGLIAATIPLLIGVISILTTMGIIYFFHHSFNLSIFILNIIPMIGLALSIDFALLFINRFKEEIKTKSVDEAILATTSTAGRAIIFSALCVFIGLLGLMFIQIDLFQNVALGGMAVVAVSALSAVTLLPAVLSLLGKKINSWSVLKERQKETTIWKRFAVYVMKRPVIMMLIAMTFLITGLLPVKNMTLAVPGIDALPLTYESRMAFDIFEEHFVDENKKNENKVVFIVETDKSILEVESLTTTKMIINKIKKDENVSEVESLFSMTGIDDPEQLSYATSQAETSLVPVINHFTSNNKMLLNVYLDKNVNEVAARDWVRNWSEEGFETTVYIGGHPKFEQEIFDEIFAKAPYGLFLILVSTFFILMIAFRSLLIPLKAILMNILSLSATFGIIVWLFQDGHFGLEPVDIALVLPVFVFTLVFGLSMDYEVFLISRIHETYLKTGDNNFATIEGLTSTSKIITSAAAIMIVITGAFAFTDVTPVKQMGVGIALAIFIDATIVRMVLVPALMKLFGNLNWWFFGMKPKSFLKGH